MAKVPIVLQINCGYARVAVFELSKGQHRSSSLAEQFQKLFSSNGFLKTPHYWDPNNKSGFLKHQSVIRDCFCKSWRQSERRNDYISSFSVSKWVDLSADKQMQHTMSNCLACANDQLELQIAFPMLPCYFPPAVVDISIPMDTTEQEVTRTVLRELNQSYQSNYQHSFLDSALKVGKALGIERRKSAVEKKRDKRKLQRGFRDAVNKHFSNNAGVSFLSENESFRGYQRKRLSQSFELLQPGKVRTHVPCEARLSCYRDVVLEKLSQWPEDEVVNWTKLARQCNIEGSNKGQIAKVIAEKNGIPASRLSSTRKPSSRLSKGKLPGKSVSIPAMPTTAVIKQDINSLIETGELWLGEPCSPFTLIKSSVVDGVVEHKNSVVYGRKIPLTELRRKLICKQEKFMRLLSDEEIAAMTPDELKSYACTSGVANSTDSLDNLKSKLKSLQRTRHLALWHDHSTILGAGYILMTVHVLYDSAVFLSNDEYERKTGENLNIQEVVEEPELYILCLSSSSPSDQIASISDRLDCLPDLKNPTKSSLGIDVYDQLRFFVGDHPAQAFERGSQLGGNYKCGDCGCLTDRMDDLAHVLRCPLRTLAELQNLILEGKYGKQAGILKPFDKLKKAELQEELRKRGALNVNLDKKELTSTLTAVLKGAQRVPTILISNPSQSLADLNLSQYAVLDSEPLHDLKGHLINLLTELPYVLEGSAKKLCLDLLTNILYSKRQNGYSGSDLRAALLQTYKLLYFQDVDSSIKMLLSTVVKISEVLYSADDKRTSKSILQLYNCTWMHHELCKSIFTNLHEISYPRLFGSYLHALAVHSPVQYEVVCLRSVNTENQERIFQQAKTIASNTTNRKPENVIPSIVLRLQAKQLNGKLSSTFAAAETEVKKVAKNVPQFERTCVSSSYINSRSYSWQAHVERISHYLVLGEGKWWKRNGSSNSFTFFDGDGDPDSHIEGPILHSFRSSSITDVVSKSKAAWKKILADKIPTPLISVREFDENGDLLSLTSAENDFNELNCSNIEPTIQHNLSSSTFDDSIPVPQAQLVVTSTPIRGSSANEQLQAAGSSTICEDCNDQFGDDTEYCDEPDCPESDVQLVLSDEQFEQTDTAPGHGLTSTLAIAIHKAIGEDQDIVYFDKLHTKLKFLRRKPSNTEETDYRRMLALLQQKVLSKKTNVACSIQKYEKDFYLKHHRLPVEQEEYNELCSKLKYMKKLLRKCKISL